MGVRLRQLALTTGLLIPLLWTALTLSPATSTVQAQGLNRMLGPKFPILTDTNGDGRPTEGSDTGISFSRTGNTVTATTPWDSCLGGKGQFLLSEPDASGKFKAASRTLANSLRNQLIRFDTFDGGAALGLQYIETRAGTTRASGNGRLTDTNGDGLMDTAVGTGTGLRGPVNVSVSLAGYDVTGDGNADYMSVPWAQAAALGVKTNDNCADPQVFVPLADSNGDGIPDSIIPDFNGDGVPDPQFYTSPRMRPTTPVTPFPPTTPPSGVLTYYMAEGATGFFELYIVLGNPNAVQAPIRVVFLKEDGTSVVRTYTLAPTSRADILVNDIPGLGNIAVSTVVESTNNLPLLVERTMFWPAGQYYGGHTGNAVSGPSLRWLFGEGSQGYFDTYVLIANSSTTTAANVTVRFLTEFNGTVVRTYKINPTSRLTVFSGGIAELVQKSFSIVVESDQPVFAERAMYFGSARFWDGGHESPGVTQASTTWFHAEGATGNFFDTFILIGNPNAAAAVVNVTYFLESGAPIQRTYNIGANARLTINVESEDPRLASTAVSTLVQSNIPVISERSMYWPGGFNSWYEAHNAFGSTGTALKWGLAEGEIGSSLKFETYILLSNTNAVPANVKITYLRTNGATVVKNLTVPASTRSTVAVASQAPELNDQTFSAVIESNQPVSVERALYWSPNGNFWWGGTAANATPLP